MLESFKYWVGPELFPYTFSALIYFGIFLVTYLMLKKNNSTAYKFGLFIFKKELSIPSYKRVDLSLKPEELRGKDITLEHFEEDEVSYLKVKKGKSSRKRQNFTLHGLFVYDRQSGYYVLKMKILLAQLLSPLIGLVVIYFFVLKRGLFSDNNLLISLAVVGITLFNVGQLIYYARKDFLASADLLEAYLNKNQKK